MGEGKEARGACGHRKRDVVSTEISKAPNEFHQAIPIVDPAPCLPVTVFPRYRCLMASTGPGKAAAP